MWRGGWWSAKLRCCGPRTSGDGRCVPLSQLSRGISDVDVGSRLGTSILDLSVADGKSQFAFEEETAGFARWMWGKINSTTLLLSNFLSSLRLTRGFQADQHRDPPCFTHRPQSVTSSCPATFVVIIHTTPGRKPAFCTCHWNARASSSG